MYVRATISSLEDFMNKTNVLFFESSIDINACIQTPKETPKKL